MALLVTMACSSERLVVGRWQQVGQDRTLQFFPDGTFLSIGDGDSATGKYSFPDTHHLKLEIDGKADVCEFTVSRKTMIVQVPPNGMLPNGQTVTLNRIE